MIVKEELKYFLKTGRFERICFGMTRDELITTLGETDWKFYVSDKDKFPAIYKYGRLEFYFNDNSKNARLVGIMFQPIPSPADHCFLKCNYHRWTKNTEINAAIQFLKVNNINFKEIPYELDEEVKLILTEGNVSVYFDCQETTGHFVLHKAGRFKDD